MVPHRLRAPAADRVVLTEPPLTEVGPLLASNRQRLADARVAILGRPLAELRPSARQTAVAAAQDYLRQAGELLPDVNADSLLLAGHQPELFHPGVWVKNFALNGLARRHHATPLNLIVDNDTVKATGLRLPDLEEARRESHSALSAPRSPLVVPFDRWAPELPYEERRVLDEDLFATLRERAAPALKGWPADILLPAFWDEVVRQARRTPLLGERFAAARRTLERSWGCHNLEVPVSLLCGTEPFAWFACHLLAHLPRFQQVHNACLQDYRRLYGLRSRSHPVPDLTAEDGWLEMPFWAWRAEQPRRGRLLARLGREKVELRVGEEAWPALPLPTSANPELVVAGWLDLEKRGFKIRSRALTNTLYARLFLGDLFIHGIGGAKYDELTDAIIRRFFEFEPPAYLVLSATLRLPLPVYAVRPEDHERLAQSLRDLHCNPQRHLTNDGAPNPEAVALAVQKRDWIARQPQTKRERRERYHTLQNLTAQLRPYVADREQQLQHALNRTDEELQVNAIRQRRDYAFCLFPEAELRAFCTQFLTLV